MLQKERRKIVHFPVFKRTFAKMLAIHPKRWYDKSGEKYTKVEEKRSSNMTNMEICYDVKNIAKYIIAYCNKNEKSITNLVLQKILYYVQGYFIKRYGMLAYEAEIVKWPYGPVVPEAYFNLCSYRNLPIQFDSEDYDECLDLITNPKHKTLINKIIERCINVSVTNIVNKTHAETPWADARMKQVIGIDKIDDYFSENDPWKICGEK